jgi:hypothetical protein
MRILYVVSGVYVSQARQLVGQDKHTNGHKYQPCSQAHSKIERSREGREPGLRELRNYV